MELAFGFEEGHADDIILILRTQQFLFLKNQVVKIYLDAADSHVIGAWETFEIVEAVAAVDDLFDVALNILSQILLFARWAAHDAPGLA